MSDNCESDLGLMVRLKAGDDSALSQIIQRWKIPVLRFAFRYLNHIQDAEEIATETFVKVHRNRAKFDSNKGKFSTWLFAIAANEAKMRLRWRKRHPEETMEDWESIRSDSNYEITPASESESKELRQMLEQAIGDLPQNLRTCFILYEVEGLPYRDIASTLGCSEKAVERRLTRAREKLRKRLQPYC